MDKTREEFITWIRMATNDKKSAAYDELYAFLCSCFIRADVEKKGLVDIAHFDGLIEEAADLPRKYGYAPKSEDLYSSEGLRKAARSKQFFEMDTQQNGYISLEDWITFATKHIVGKVAQLPKDYLSGSSSDVSKEEFICFIKKAMDRKSNEYQELYCFLMRTFQAGDVDGIGAVTPQAFDNMIECAAQAPRRFGLAPKTKDMFKNDADRLAKRMEHFSMMDKQSKGSISFNDWLEFAMNHILGKVNKL